MSLTQHTATELIKLLDAKQTTSVEIVKAYLDRIDKVDPQVKAFLNVRHEQALSEAASIDDRRQRGDTLGALAGLPVAVKDVLCTQGEKTTCGSRMLENFRPPYDATLVAKIKAADGVIIGKTNMDEFAMGGSNENSAYHPTHNPWDLTRIPGGSSGGAAACVAADMAPLSIGTDTGGSIRQPAGLCGVTGMKPTYGRVSRFGLVAFASSLDQAGPLAHTAEDNARLLEVIAGHDPLDSTSVDIASQPYSQTVGQPLAGLKLGLVREHFGEGLDAEVEKSVREAVKVYESLGATVRDISMPHGKYGVATYYVIAPCEASSNLARYDGVHYGHRTDEKKMIAELNAERKALEKSGDTKGLHDLDNSLVRMYRRSRAEGFGAEVKRRIMLGTYALSSGYRDAYYLQALKVRRLIRRDYDDAFKDVDLIIGPVTATTAFKIGEKADDPLAMYLIDLYTVSANLAGLGGIAFPCGISREGLPIGVQLQGPAFAEDRLLRAAHMFQQATDWHTKKPQL